MLNAIIMKGECMEGLHVFGTFRRYYQEHDAMKRGPKEVKKMLKTRIKQKKVAKFNDNARRISENLGIPQRCGQRIGWTGSSTKKSLRLS